MIRKGVWGGGGGWGRLLCAVAQDHKQVTLHNRINSVSWHKREWLSLLIHCLWMSLIHSLCLMKTNYKHSSLQFNCKLRNWRYQWIYTLVVKMNFAYERWRIIILILIVWLYIVPIPEIVEETGNRRSHYIYMLAYKSAINDTPNQMTTKPCAYLHISWNIIFCTQSL